MKSILIVSILLASTIFLSGCTSEDSEMLEYYRDEVSELETQIEELENEIADHEYCQSQFQTAIEDGIYYLEYGSGQDAYSSLDGVSSSCM